MNVVLHSTYRYNELAQGSFNESVHMPSKNKSWISNNELENTARNLSDHSEKRFLSSNPVGFSEYDSSTGMEVLSPMEK